MINWFMLKLSLTLANLKEPEDVHTANINRLIRSQIKLLLLYAETISWSYPIPNNKSSPNLSSDTNLNQNSNISNQSQ